MKGERTRRCRYCGKVAMDGPTCAQCRELEESDPARLAELGPIGEAELGVAELWPAGESVDRGGEE